MQEKEWIERLIKLMPRSELQINKPFESDSEILKYHNSFLLFNIDEFSGEDLFLEHDPYVLGHNIACGTLSDIYASGGIPQYLALSLTIDKQFTPKYTEHFYKGMADVLRAANVSFIGGDFSKADTWRCNACAIGESKKPILRSGARVGDSIYLTGALGAGNIAAAVRLYHAPFSKIEFHLKHEDAALMRTCATSCIDTSDGVYKAVLSIADESQVGFALDRLPYAKSGRIIAKVLGLPEEMLFFCECGEYELLFTAPPGAKLPFIKIGTVTERVRTLKGKDISNIKISAREFEDPKQYLKAVQTICEEL